MPDHDWREIVAPNGDRGFQCQRCRLTCIALENGERVSCPPPAPPPTLDEILRLTDASFRVARRGRGLRP